MNRVYFFILGFVILLAGYVSAGLVWRAQDRLDKMAQLSNHTLGQRREAAVMEGHNA